MERHSPWESLGDRLRQWPMWAAVGTLGIASILTSWPASFSGKYHVIEVVGLPWVTTFILVFLTPIPWQYGGSDEEPPSFSRGLVQAFFSLEIVVPGFAVLDALCLVKAGRPVLWRDTLLSNFLYFAPANILVGNLIATRERVEKERTLARLETQEAQTRLLQSQLHPHVLFNSLNGLLELVHKDANAAERCIRAMSELLQRLLRASEQTYFRIAEERQLVEHYLDLEKMRLGDRLDVEWDWEASLQALLVPPLLLQPLVENAIKHGIAPLRAGGRIRISVRRAGERLILLVENTGNPPQGGLLLGGVGVKNLKARLKLAYGKEAGFSLSRIGEWTQARVELPLARSEGAS